MPGTDSSTRELSFGAFTLDFERGALHGPDGELRLRPKSYEVLCHLVLNHGRLVTKDELLDAVWGRAVVTEDSLTQCLVEIRRALGDDARAMIRTVPRRGYIFDTPLEPESRRNTGGPGAAGIAAALAIAAIVTTAWLLNDRPSMSATTTIASLPASSPGVAVPPNSIAVLPFTDMSAAQDQEYFGDGIAEEILNALAQARGIKVIARTSSFSFKQQAADISTIAARLGVAHVLEGSVRKDGNRIRVTAQLINARDSSHLWSETYERELGDLFRIQDDIAAAVATMLKAQLLKGNPDARQASRDPRAHDHFLRARFLHNRRDLGDSERAREHLETAVEIDPGFAPAWAALAGVYAVQLSTREIDRESGLARRREAVERALALDPELPEAHLRARAVYLEDGEHERAEQHWQLARVLDPDNPLLLGHTAGGLLAHGQVDEALELWQRVVALDPLSRISRSNHAHKLAAVGRFEDARSEFLVARELGPSRTAEIDVELAKLLLVDGQYEDALALLDGVVADMGDVARAAALHALGREEDAAAALARLQAMNTSEGAVAVAEVHAHRGDHDEAFVWLAEARGRFIRDSFWGARRFAQFVHVSALLHPLHGDARWQQLTDIGPLP
jgi:TolB-like protein/DNA-binding winged helix-turn-helix (wHTH) protein/Tfp pilus assembly protein PilF